MVLNLSFGVWQAQALPEPAPAKRIVVDGSQRIAEAVVTGLLGVGVEEKHFPFGIGGFCVILGARCLFHPELEPAAVVDD